MTIKARRFFIRQEDPPAKQAILESALRCFVRDGIAATSVRMIANEAGFTNPALFKHFDGKEALARYLFESCYREVGGRIFGQLDPSAPFPDRLETVMARILRLIDEEIEPLLYIQDNLRLFWPELRRELRSYSLLGQLERLVQDGRAAGYVNITVDIKLQVAAIAGIVNQVAREHYFGELRGRAQKKLSELYRIVEGMLRPAGE